MLYALSQDAPYPKSRYNNGMKTMPKSHKKDAKPHYSKLSFLAPLLSAFIFSLLTCLNLRTAMWFDESYSAYIIRGDFGQIWHMTAMDVHPPFYYFCLKIWSLLFGTTDFALRSMSVFFGGVAIILAFFLLRRWFGEKAAAISTFALSLAPILIRYSQEMRMYAIVFAIVIGTTYVLDIALKSKKKLAWLFYALLICLGMWTHYFTALAWLAHLGYIIYYFRKHGLQKTVFWAYPLAVILYLPWLPSFFNQVKQVQSGFWIPPVDLATPFGFVSESLIYRNVSETQSWYVLLVLAVIVLTVYLLTKTLRQTTKDSRQNFILLTTLTFAPPVLLMLLSFPPFQPTYVARYVVYSASLLWVLIGLAIHWGKSFNKQKAAGLLAILALVSATIGIVSVDSRDNSNDTRAIITAVKTISSNPSPILVHVGAMDYYDLFFYETPEHPVYGIDVDFIWSSLEPIREYQQNYLENSDAFIAGQNDFWIIVAADDDKEYTYEDFSIINTIKTDKFIATEYVRK